MRNIYDQWPPIVLLMVALIISGCTTVAEKGAKPSATKAADNQGLVLAQMGNVKLTEAYLQNLLADMNPADKDRVSANPQLAEQLVREQVIKFYLLDLAKKTGWSQRPDIMREAKRAANKTIVASFLNSKAIVSRSFPDDAMIQKSYAENIDRLRQPNQVRLSQIFIAGQNERERNKIKVIHQRLVEQPRRFADLAQQYSEHDSSAANGGDLGWKPQNVLLPSLLEVVIRMNPGDISPPVRTSEGLHIIQLSGRKVGDRLTLEQARPYIIDQLRIEAANRNEKRYLQNVLKNNPVTVETEALTRMLQNE